MRKSGVLEYSFIVFALMATGLWKWTHYQRRRVQRTHLELFAARRQWTIASAQRGKHLTVEGRSGVHQVAVDARLKQTKFVLEVSIPSPAAEHIMIRREPWMTAGGDVRFGIKDLDALVRAQGNERILLARLCSTGRPLIRAHLMRTIESRDFSGVIGHGIISFQWYTSDPPDPLAIDGIVNEMIGLAEHLCSGEEDDDRRLLRNVQEGPTPENRRLCFHWIARRNIKLEAAKSMSADTDLENQILGASTLKASSTLSSLFETALGQNISLVQSIATALASVETAAARSILVKRTREGGVIGNACLELLPPGSESFSLEDLKALAQDPQTSPLARAHLVGYLAAHGSPAGPLLIELLSGLEEKETCIALALLGKEGTAIHVPMIQARSEGLFGFSGVTSAATQAIAQIQARSVGQAGGLALSPDTEDENRGGLGLIEDGEERD